MVPENDAMLPTSASAGSMYQCNIPILWLVQLSYICSPSWLFTMLGIDDCVVQQM